MQACLRRGADPTSLEANSGRTALHKAAFWGHAHVISFLATKCLANVSCADFAGDTPLHDAARFGHAKIAKALLDVGADCAATNKAGQTALDLAKLHEKADVVALLTGHAKSEMQAAAKARRESFLLAGAPVAAKTKKK